MNNLTAVFLGIVAACALLSIGAVLLWAPPCSGGLETTTGNVVPMRCTWTAHVGALLGIVLAVVSLVALALKRNIDVLLCIVLVLLSAALFAISFESPLTIGVCKSEGMACAATALWLRGCGIVSLVAAVAGALANPNRKRV